MDAARAADHSPMAPLRRLGERLRSEQGFSLTELLVATSMMLVVLFAAMGFAEIAPRSASGAIDRSGALATQRTGLERMTRELRQALTLNATTPGVVEFQLYRPGTGAVRQVRYDCSQAGECRRSEGPAGGPLANTDTLVTGVQSASFTSQTLSASQDYLTISLWVNVPNRAHPIALEDGVHLRNKATPN
jgi:Tfp pilus assembly protein PilW